MEDQPPVIRRQGKRKTGSWEERVKYMDRDRKKGREKERREGIEKRTESCASGATKPGGGWRESWEAYRHGFLTTTTNKH